MSDYPIPDVIRESPHRHDDDLLTAGLGLAGLRDPRKPAFTDATTPTPTELRRRAIHASWRAIADLEPTGGFGEIYGQAPRIPGREYHAFARLPGAQTSHRVLLQAPDDFDRRIRCLIVTASPGSRGIYGGIALAGAWGLPRGCAVVYTDKGAGSGYFDAHSGSGVRLDGTRAAAGEDVLEFEPLIADPEGGIGIKHAHSGDNPEASWGDHVLQALNFGLAMLDRAYPDAAPFSPENTRIIATGLSNGGAAILQAAGRDTANQLDGAVAISPNVLTPNRGRAFYDYTSEVALLIGSALAAPSLLGIAQARHADAMPDHVAWGEGLAEAGVLSTNRSAEYAEEALSRLHTMGWSTAALQAALLTGDTEIWRAAGAVYAGSYLCRPMGELPCEEGFLARVPDTQGQLRPAGALLRSTWWADAPGIPPVWVWSPRAWRLDGLSSSRCFAYMPCLPNLPTRMPRHAYCAQVLRQQPSPCHTKTYLSGWCMAMTMDWFLSRSVASRMSTGYAPRGASRCSGGSRMCSTSTPYSVGRRWPHVICRCWPTPMPRWTPCGRGLVNGSLWQAAPSPCPLVCAVQRRLPLHTSDWMP
nr:3-hydroxybutyrate oligomer hydrolase family protein [Acidihalobacter yilgarnensis]